MILALANNVPPSLWEEEDVEETDTEDADEDTSPEFSGDEDDTPVPKEPEEMKFQIRTMMIVKRRAPKNQCQRVNTD
jgi:hypothetical protein